jgi:DNA repair protein RadC
MPACLAEQLAALSATCPSLYRLNKHGTAVLSTSELLALVFGSADGLSLAQELLARFDSLHRLARVSEAQLTRVNGIGPVQAARLAATLELSRRLQLPPSGERLRVSSPADAANLLMPEMGHLDQEELRVIVLDTRNNVLKIPTIYKGSLNTSVVRVAEVLRPAIELQGAAQIVAHNHPSQDPSPSPEDVRVTRQIVKAGKLLDIDVLDHLIVSSSRYVSLKERALGFDA